MAFHRFGKVGELHGSFETFYHEGGYDMMPEDVAREKGIEPMKPGWYWWACFPGCLPDSEEHGPFATEEAAIANADEEGS